MNLENLLQSVTLLPGGLPSGIVMPPKVATLLSSRNAASQPIGGSLFGALRESLADFRAQVEGEPGRLIRAMGHSPGAIPELARTVLGALGDALAALAGALADAVKAVQDFIVIADAIAALVEVAADAVMALSEIVLHAGPEMLGLPAGPLNGIRGSINLALDTVKKVTGYVPSPDDLAGVLDEFGKLLGAKANPAIQGPGAFGKLLLDIGVGGAAAEGGAS